jgi:hypothetical protein
VVERSTEKKRRKKTLFGGGGCGGGGYRRQVAVFRFSKNLQVFNLANLKLEKG